MRMRSSWIGALSAVVCTALLAVALSAPEPAKAASNMAPDYEVKLLLNPSAVLNSNNKLNSTVRSAFGMPGTVTKMNVQFMDTNNKDIYNNGWVARVRKTEDENDFELTYKKRYPITDGDIDAALTQANLEGFDSGDTNYEAQVEWGYQKQTLSLSRVKNDSKSGYSGMDLPSASNSRKLLVKNVPGKMNDWLYNNWGTDKLNASRIYGPILSKRYTGTWSGMKTYIEIWPIKNAAGTGTEYVVEASFKTTSRTAAQSKHDEMIAYLQNKGWFLPEDSLKTQLIMDRY